MSIAIDYDLTPEDRRLAQDLIPEFYNVETVGPVALVRNWREDFETDMKLGKGFVVRAKPFKKKLKDKDGNIMSKGVKEMYGIHSPLFGSDWQDEHAFADRYSCECGDLIGRIFEGQRCPKCGKKVKYTDVDLKIFAYLCIENPKFAIIHPLMYKKIDNFIGKNILSQIIDFKMEMKLDGYYAQPEDVDLTKNPFYGIGLVEFRNRFDEIMEFYRKKRKSKALMYRHIMDNRKNIFVNEIPVYSAVLREVFFTNEDYSYTRIDTRYNALYGNICKLNEETEILNRNIAKINKNLYRAQYNLNEAWDLIFDSINEKEGLIRRNILGGRINFSSRCVIVPDADLRSNEVRLPYVCFVEMWKPDIINLLVKLDGISYDVAVDRWFEGYREFDEKIYQIILYILKKSKHHVKIMLNRNPTINMGSYLNMRVKTVKRDYNDLSCSIPIQSLQSLNADFDGDVLNIVRLIGNEFTKEFGRIFDPHKAFLIDHNNGLFNSSFGLIKDEMINFYVWNTI